MPNNPSQKRNNLDINRNIPEETSPGSSQNLTNSPDGKEMHLNNHKADKNKYKNAKVTKKWLNLIWVLSIYNNDRFISIISLQEVAVIITVIYFIGYL